MGESEYYPPPAFHFMLSFISPLWPDTAFQEVDGIGSEMEFQEFIEMGEHRFVHRLPKGVKHPLLRLKRGVAGQDSPLVSWCKSILEGNFAQRIDTQEVLVFLLNEEHVPLRGWSFANVYPIKWEIGAFHSTKNEVAIETIELSYTYSNRVC